MSAGSLREMQLLSEYFEKSHKLISNLLRMSFRN